MTPSAPGQRREPAPARAGTLRNRKARRYQAEPAWKTFNFNEQEQAASRNAVNVRAAGPRAFAIRNSARIALGDVPHHGRSGQVRGIVVLDGFCKPIDLAVRSKLRSRGPPAK